MEKQKIEELEKKIQDLEVLLESEKKRLREAAGAWRRKLAGKGRHRTSLREGYNYNHDTHYKVFILDEIPSDLAIDEVLAFIKKEILPSLYPYKFSKIDYSYNKDYWILEVVNYLDIDMSYMPEENLLKKVYNP